jgi:DNA invertase Pin-like site-specific DNA recombinase
MLAVIGAVGQAEREAMLERQREGIAKAKADGKYKGRPPEIDATKVFELRGMGVGPAAIAKELGIARSSVYRMLENRVEASRDADVAARKSGAPNLSPAGYQAWSDLKEFERADD